MKILYVVQRFLPVELTGSEVVFANLATRLARRAGHDVVVATANIEAFSDCYQPSVRRFAPSEVVGGVRVRRLGVNWAYGACCHVAYRLMPWVDAWTGGVLGVRAYGPHLVGLGRVIRDERPDLVHAGPMPLYHVFATGRIARRRGLPFVVTPMMHFELAMLQNPRIFSALTGADAVVAFTSYERERLAEHGVERSRVQVIPATSLSPVDFVPGDGNAFRCAHGLTDEPLVLFLGSKTEGKGALFLLEAWPAIRSRVPHARLVYAGGGSESWRRALAGRETSGIIDVDYVHDQAKRDLLAAADVLCVPSMAESFGIVVLEAWAQGKAVVGGPAGATRELIAEGEDGFTVEFGDVAALAARVGDLMSDPVRCRRLGAAGRRKAERFTEDAVVGRTIELYAGLTGSAADRRTAR